MPKDRKSMQFGFCPCRKSPFRGRQLERHIKNSQHVTKSKFLVCLKHLDAITWTGDEDDSNASDFYNRHSSCEGGGTVKSERNKNFFAALATNEYVRGRSERREAEAAVVEDRREDEGDLKITVDDEEDEDQSEEESEEESEVEEEEKEQQEQEAEEEDFWKKALDAWEANFPSVKASAQEEDEERRKEESEAAKAVRELELAELTEVANPVLIPGHSMKTFSINGLKDSLGKEKAINEDLRKEVEKMQRKVSTYEARERKNMETEEVLIRTEGVLREKALEVEKRERELKQACKKMKDMQKKIEEEKVALQEKARKNEETFEQRSKYLKEVDTKMKGMLQKLHEEKSKRDGETCRKTTFHIPIMNDEICGDPAVDGDCFPNMTCGHLSLQVTGAIKSFKWRNQKTRKRGITCSLKENSSEDDKENEEEEDDDDFRPAKKRTL